MEVVFRSPKHLLVRLWVFDKADGSRWATRTLALKELGPYQVGVEVRRVDKPDY